MNSGIANIEEADAILLIGVDPRKDAAMINARIRKSHVHNRTPIAMIGEACDLNYPVEGLGDTPADIETFMKSKTGFAKLFKSAKKPLLIAGMSCFQREDGLAIQHKLYQLAEKFKLIKDDWNGFNVLHQAAGRVGALTVGFTPKKKSDLSFDKMIFASYQRQHILKKTAHI